MGKIIIEGTNILTSISDPWSGVGTGEPVYGQDVPVGVEWGVNKEEIQRFLKTTMNEKAGCFYYDTEVNMYYIFADEESRDLYYEDPIEHAELLLGSFEAPSNYNAEITLHTPVRNVILSGTTGNYIDFEFDVKNKSGASTGEDVVVTYTFNNSGNIKKFTQIYSAGTQVHFLVDSYLNDGNNNIGIVVTGRSTAAVTMAAVNYVVVALQFESSFDFSKAVVKPNPLAIMYHLKGAGVKYIEWYIDGIILSTVDNITDMEVNREKNIDVTSLSEGKHTVQARAYIVDDNTNYYSNTLYFDFVVAPQNEIWNVNSTFVLLGLVLPTLQLEGPSISVKQYETFNYSAAVYDSRKRVLDLIISDNGDEIKRVSANPEEVQQLQYTPITVGEHTLTFTSGGATAEIDADVTQGEVDIQEATSGMTLKLSAKGRSNGESNPAVWEYGQYSTTFNYFKWNQQSGWNNDALIIKSGTSIDIDFAPLAQDPTRLGRTIEIEYEAVDITNEDATVLSLVNPNNNAGIEITASTATLRSSSGVVGGTGLIDTKYNTGDRIKLAFIINRTVGDNARMMYIVNNGILERANAYAQNDSFETTSTMHIGSTGCTIKLYSIRCYDRALSVEEAFCNYAVDSEDIFDVVSRNNVLDTSRPGFWIDADKVNAKLPILIITGDMTEFNKTQDKKFTIYVDVEYRNLQEPTKNFKATNLRMRPQGTSSLAYPRKNLRLYTAAEYGCTMTDSTGAVIEDGLYAFKDKSQPVNCWTLKADYAESSGSHNTGIARFWNDTMYKTQLNGQYVLRTEAQKTAADPANEYDYDVRTTIDGFPIVVFNRTTADSELICLGQYNFNNDKSTEKVFGFIDIPNFDSSHVQCFEFLDSSNRIALFDDISNFYVKNPKTNKYGWEEAWEFRFPDLDTNYDPVTVDKTRTALYNLATWINSCKYDQQKWNDEKEDHFDLNKLAAYYVYLMRLGAVDQTVKNAMLTTEDGIHWYFINYDNDTVMGIDNNSELFNAYNYDRQSINVIKGNYYYAGHDSVLWNCFEADNECMALVKDIDTALYQAGFNYTTLLRYFDVDQCNKWCERIYNDNGQYKYIQPFFNPEGSSNYLHMLQGSRTSYRHWWLQHRMDMYDALWASGSYKARNIMMKFTQKVDNFVGNTVTITASKDSYFGYGINNVPQEVGIHLAAGESYTFDIDNIGIGNPVYLYNANNIASVTLSNDAVTLLNSLDLRSAIGTDGRCNLKSLILGDGTQTNTALQGGISGLSIATDLEELDIRGYETITDIDLSGFSNLRVFKAEGSRLSSFAPAEGLHLEYVGLPTTLQSLSVDGITLYVGDTWNYSPTTSLTNVSFKNYSLMINLDVETWCLNWVHMMNAGQLSAAYLTLYGIDWNNATVLNVLDLGSVGHRDFRGLITLSAMTHQGYQQICDLYGSNVFVAGGVFTINAPSGSTMLFTGGDSSTSIIAGNSGLFAATFFPILEGDIQYILYNDSGVEIQATEDQQGNTVRVYGGITLYEESGTLSVDISLSLDTYIKVTAYHTGSQLYTEFSRILCKRITYPSSVLISGISQITGNNTYGYFPRAFDTNNFNAEVISWSWTFSSEERLTKGNALEDKVYFGPAIVDTTEYYVTITYTVTFTGNVTLTNSKQVLLQKTWPNVNQLEITGDSELDDNDTYDYSCDADTPYATATLLDASWSITSNQYVTIEKLSNGDGQPTYSTARVSIPNGNPTQVTLTITITLVFEGNVTVTKTKDIVVDEIEAPVIEEWVDLGLSSGLLWCTHNVGASSDTKAGLYFAWGETTGYADAAARNTALGRSDGFSSNAYKATDASTISANLTLAQDAAQAYMGADWRMPTKVECDELISGCDVTWTSKDGVNGELFTSKANGNSIFIPAAGSYNGTDNSTNGRLGNYLTSTYTSNDYTPKLNFSSSSASVPEWAVRCLGSPIRPVREAPKAIDLGLPSGTLWADRNVGATAPEGYGLYFSWGNTDGHEEGSGYDFGDANYNASPGKQITGDIALSQDAANAYLGGSYRMPTRLEFQELYDNCNSAWVTENGVDGGRFTSKTNGNSIFFPAAGGYNGTSLNNRGSYGYYWSASRVSDSNGYRLLFSSGFVAPQNSVSRRSGFSVRAVQ